jgi:phospholipid transport system substrate-binding protein
MMRKITTTLAGLMLSLFLAAVARPASAGAPTEQVQGTVDNILAILKNPRLRGDAVKKERRDQLREAIFARFDFPEMSKRSLGTQWRKLSPSDQEEFVKLFTDLLERTYINQIEAYKDEKVVFLKETLDNNFAEVQSRIVNSKGEDFSLNYRAHRVGEEWKVYDVVVENISVINNYRAQFNRILANQSYEELLRRMKDKQIEFKGDKK